MNSVQIHVGDCLDALREMPDGSIDSIVTDPPYGLSFMGKRWDYDVPSVEIWEECLRVLKPGGHLLAFAGTRTQHRMAVRIEDAGFEIRDMIAWVYGCLDEATEVATERGVVPYHKTKIGDRVLCYDVEHGEYTYQPILEIVEYNYSDTAYRLVGDFGEQVVSRSHRVIVERDGSEAFQLAETLECEARVPILESLPALRQAVHDAHQRAGSAQQDVQCHLCKCADWRCECRVDSTGSAQGQDDQVRSLREQCMEACRMAAQGGDADLQQGVQRGATRCRVGRARAQGAGKLDSRVGGRIEGANDRRIEPCLEGRADLPQSEGRVCASADQVREMPGSDVADGAVGRLCDGASTGCGADHQPAADAEGVRSPHQPRRDGQPGGEPDVVCQQRAAQGVRAWGGHRSAVVRVVPFHYTGKVWCLRVPTGAFVAVRNGVAFPTGNSGFPKSLDVSKAIDKAAGAEREVVGVNPNHRAVSGVGYDGVYQGGNTGAAAITAPATEAARQWQGWGTALKPALEPITVARKPLEGTVAANVLEHGTGALNIDGCRVDATGDAQLAEKYASVQNAGRRENNVYGSDSRDRAGAAPHQAGRFPANLIHDGSDEAVAGFPRSKSCSTPSAAKPEGAILRGARSQGAIYPGEDGSAARFFYCAKASKRDRDEGLDECPDAARRMFASGGRTMKDGEWVETNSEPQARKNSHPTVKPTDLMRYLCRLVTPPGGVVLDPFMGSGSTGKAAILEGFRFIGCELSPEYAEIAKRRIAATQAQPGRPKQETTDLFAA